MEADKVAPLWRCDANYWECSVESGRDAHVYGVAISVAVWNEWKKHAMISGGGSLPRYPRGVSGWLQCANSLFKINCPKSKLISKYCCVCQLCIGWGVCLLLTHLGRRAMYYRQAYLDIMVPVCLYGHLSTKYTTAR